MKIRNIKFIGLLVSFALAIAGVCSLQPLLAHADAQQPVVVSLGDSYSSGEGVEPFYGQDSADKYTNYDWLAHRSAKSWPGQLQFTRSGTAVALSEQKGQSWYFAANSGARLNHLTNGYTISPTRKAGISCEALPSVTLPGQLAVFDDNNLTGKVDYVTITLGGNDVGFSEVITQAVLNPAGLQQTVNEKWVLWDSTVKPNMIASYRLIREKAGPDAHIIVVGYPQLFNPAGGGVVTAKNAGIINDSVHRFNEEIKAIVDSLRAEGDTNFHFVSVEEAFAGHGAYSDEPYINPIILGPQSQEIKQCESGNLFYSLMPSAYSIHPNEAGAAAYASAVQAAIDAIETHAVSFNGNGSTGGSTVAVSGKHGLSVQLTANGFTRTDYTFQGWNTAVNGTGTAYSDGASFTIPGSDTTLYAQWAPNVIPGEDSDHPNNYVKVTFNPGTHGSVISGESVYWVSPGQTVSLTVPTVKAENGFVNTGWDSSAAGAFTSDTVITMGQMRQLINIFDDTIDLSCSGSACSGDEPSVSPPSFVDENGNNSSVVECDESTGKCSVIADENGNKGNATADCVDTDGDDVTDMCTVSEVRWPQVDTPDSHTQFLEVTGTVMVGNEIDLAEPNEVIDFSDRHLVQAPAYGDVRLASVHYVATKVGNDTFKIAYWLGEISGSPEYIVTYKVKVTAKTDTANAGSGSAVSENKAAASVRTRSLSSTGAEIGATIALVILLLGLGLGITLRSRHKR